MTSDQDTDRTFSALVRERLPVIDDPRANAVVDRAIDELHERGWTVDEVARYCRCFEEVNPDLNEDFALARMKKIHDQVKARMGVKAPMGTCSCKACGGASGAIYADGAVSLYPEKNPRAVWVAGSRRTRGRLRGVWRVQHRSFRC